ncbi:MAG: HAMP domain-containing sensor histidine kinase [Planctomycetota bacterium]
MTARAPANIYLRRAQLILLLVAVATTIVTTPVGIVLLASKGSYVVAVVSGVLVLAFCASSVAGYVLGSIFLRRSASLVDTQNQFLSAVSHELRTPITSMRMFLEALLDDRLADRAERDRCLTSLRTETMRLDDLVGRLIELSRVESGRQVFAREPVGADELVEAAMNAFAAIRLDTPADIAVRVEPGLQILGDRAALVQVFVNLLSNAWKYGGEPRRIRFVVETAPGGRVAFQVDDNGPGIPREERSRVFGMFERGAAAVRAGAKGSGLGLAIVRAIVGNHRGRIELGRSPEGGCRFRVLFRRHHPKRETRS